ncbi:MAG: hypothetical protein IKF19_01920 [Bacilli bacterium]|nr:hypothetical protein [Bacilli bacterium]
MRDRVLDKLSVAITILIVLLVVYFGFTLVNRINAKKEIKNNIKEIFNDYRINDLKSINIVIHSKSNYQSKISYNVSLRSNKYNKLNYDIQKEIIKYIKNISFKGNNKKYTINKVIIYSGKNIYSYKNIFRKNDELYGSINEKYSDATSDIKDKIKDKINDIKENFTE